MTGRYGKPEQCRFRDAVYNVTEKTIFGVYVSPGSGKTLVRRDGITNHHSIAYSPNNITVKITNISFCSFKL